MRQAVLFTDVLEVPKYVNGSLMKINTQNVLDQYFTSPDTAQSLYQKAQNIIKKYEKNLDDFTWIEPSAGNGVFFDLLPAKRIGIDIHAQRGDILEQNYLDYTLPSKKTIVIGNPPFGHRGVVALDFINHSKNADYVCFILPMFFESKGKGSIKYRVQNLHLIHSEILPLDSFYMPSKNKLVDVKCVFQIWSKNYKVENQEFSWYNNGKNEPFTDIVKVFTVSMAKNRECGKRWIFEEKADFYISSTFHDKISIVYSFEEVKYKSGVAVVFTTENNGIKQKIKDIFENTNWKDYGSLATNSCYHLGKSNIYQVLKDNIEVFDDVLSRKSNTQP
jgi:hypothetical protein